MSHYVDMRVPGRPQPPCGLPEENRAYVVIRDCRSEGAHIGAGNVKVIATVRTGDSAQAAEEDS